jgi:ubiquinone/menaquinone biosynthesis C-methylase UbiE
MNEKRSGFDRLARPYRLLEFIAFGRDLERARFEFLGRLAGCRDVLLLGEGDGRCAARLADLAPAARILCVDSSPGMIARASRRMAASAAERVSFLRTDVRSFVPEPGRFDAVATLFFLDCFDGDGVESIVGRMTPALRPGAMWLFADFSVPRRGFARLRARAWLAVLYSFFRWGAGLQVSSLPPSEEALERAGWSRIECREFQFGMIRSAVFIRPGGLASIAAREAST